MTGSRKTNGDHGRKKQTPMVEDEVIPQQLERLLTPAITNQENYYRKLGLRQRILNLLLIMAAVLTLTVARYSRSERTDKSVSQRWFSVV
jgi:hypothetical protein